MADRFRDFDAFEAEHKSVPITFKLGGRKWSASHLDAPTFLSFTRRMAEGGEGAIIGFAEFMHSVVDEEQREEFEAVLTTKHIRLDTLVEVMKWLVEQATNSPLDAANVLPLSPSKPGPRQKAGSSSVVSLSRNSHSARG
jgi:hypothetical protein